MPPYVPSSSKSSPLLISYLTTPKDELKKIRNELELLGPQNANKIFILQSSAANSNIRDSIKITYGINARAEDKEATAAYLNNLINATYPESYLEKEMIQSGFQSYLKDQNNELSVQECLTYLKELHLSHLDYEVDTLANAPDALPFAGDHSEKINSIKTRDLKDASFFTNLKEFLKTKGVTISDDVLGKGTYGIAYQAKLENKSEDYVFKFEKKASQLNGTHPQFWREGDAAAARIHNVTNRAKTLFFIISVKSPDMVEEFHYIPAPRLKNFGMQLPKGSNVFLHGQLMEKASGESIWNLVKQGKIADPTSQDFKNIARGLFTIIKEMQVHNLVHRDIKLDNLSYDFKTGKVMIIDFGLAERLRKKNKPDNTSHVNPVTSKMSLGIAHYMSPRISNGETHGAEVDLFTYAVALLNLISPEECSTFYQTKSYNTKQEQHHILSNIAPENYLDRYLEIVGTNGKTAKILASYPELATVIHLAFQASAGGNLGNSMAERLKNLPYFKA